tara:strand:- start:1626 stop:1898 length:273 start_codon:yes stop_codon:yes gene_type:complete
MAKKFRKPLSATTLRTLKAKAKKSKLFNLADLKASFRRGQGAFLSSGSRPKIPMQAWAMARVNKLISRGRSGTFDKDIILRASKRNRKKK